MGGGVGGCILAGYMFDRKYGSGELGRPEM